MNKNFWTRELHAYFVFVLVLGAGISAQANAALLNFPATPLFITATAQPNIMMMFDNSGSMENVSPEPPFTPAINYVDDPSTTAIETSCPAANQIPTTAVILDLWIRRSDNRIIIRVDNQLFLWGTRTDVTRRCFNPTSKYDGVRLVTQVVGVLSDGSEYRIPFTYGGAKYDGNYLNWYFNDRSVSGITWNSEQARKPLSAAALVNRRIDVAKNAANTLVSNIDSRVRLGLSAYNSNDGSLLLQTVKDITPTYRTAMQSSINTLGATTNTPLAETLSDIGRYFSTGHSQALVIHPSEASRRQSLTRDEIFDPRASTTNFPSNDPPINLECQQSFAVLVTDGQPTQDQAINTPLQDYDNDCNGASPACLSFDQKDDGTHSYGPNGSDYLDDVAQALFEMDLRPDFEAAGGKPFKNNVVTYMVAFADENVINDPLLAETARQGGGELLIAADAQALADSFTDVINRILDTVGSAGSASVNSSVLNTDTAVFQAKFNSGRWIGDLLSIPVSNGATGACSSQPVGALCPSASWQAANVLDATAPSSRVILTTNIDNTVRVGVPFRWGDIGTTNQSLLNRDFFGNPDSSGSNRLSYLRGDRSLETAGSGFRARASRLGDIVNSDPYFVAEPPFAYPFGGYSSFRTANRNRTKMVYVGGNDGMLHGFRASDGRELLAYVPTKAYGTGANPKLAKLTSSRYNHDYFVDGAPNVGDVQVGSGWKSYFVGSLRQGGQGIYALDVTNPNDFKESNASNIVKWEFTDRDDVNLGYSFGQPSIVKMANGKWAAIIGNGYNNTEPDGRASSTGSASIFIIFTDGPGADGIWDSNEYVKLTVNGGGTVGTPNGIGSVAPIDLDGDDVVDYIYAGDLNGNVWRFDVNTNSTSTWAVGRSGQPVFVAKDAANNLLPITERPEVGLNLNTSKKDDLTVYFGTGRYMDTADQTTVGQRTQAFFGIFDDPKDSTFVPATGHGQLLQQSVVAEVNRSGQRFRITSDTPLNTATHKGWYINLISPGTSNNKGERQVSNPVLRSGRIIFTTLIPSADPCDVGGDGWFMEINAKDGTRPSAANLDTNRDRQVDDNDLITVQINGQDVQVAVSGLGSTVGILSAPAMLYIDAERDARIIAGSSGNIEETIGKFGLRSGRITWREIPLQ